MVVQVAAVLSFARDGWFGFDGLHYLVYRGPLPEADLGLIEAWGGHWQTIPFLVYRALFAAFEWTYVGYLATALALHLAVTAAWFAILRRVGAPPVAALASAWLLLFFGAGAEVYVSDAPIPLTLALLFVLGAVWLLAGTQGGRPHHAAAAALLVVAVMTSAVGVVGLVLVAGFCVGAGRARRALVVAPAALAFVAWFALVGRKSPRVSLDDRDLAEIPAFVWRGLSQALGGIIGVPESGVVLLVLLVAALVFLPGPSAELRALAWAGVVAAGAQLAAAATASLRFIQGSEVPSRYLYVAFALMLPAVAYGVSALVRLVAARATSRQGATWAALIGVGLLASAAAQGIQQERSSAEFAVALSKPMREWVHGADEAVRAGQEMLNPLPQVTFGEAMDMRDVTALTARHPLPRWDEGSRARLTAENQFFVAVGPKDPQLFQPIFIDGSGFTTPFRPRPGCRTYEALALSDPVLRFSTGQSNAVGVTSESTTVTTRVIRDEEEGPARTWEVSPGPVFVGSTATDAVIEVTFNGDGAFVVCHR